MEYTITITALYIPWMVTLGLFIHLMMADTGNDTYGANSLMNVGRFAVLTLTVWGSYHLIMAIISIFN